MVGSTRLKSSSQSRRSTGNVPTSTSVDDSMAINSNEKELEVSRLNVLIDTCHVSLTALLLTEDQQHAERLRGLIREADEAEHLAQNMRNGIVNSRTNAKAKLHRKETVQKEIDSLKTRLASHEKVIQEEQDSNDMAKAHAAEVEQQQQSQRIADLSIRGASASPPSGRAASMTATEDEVEDMEGKVIALREVHANLYGNLRNVKMEVEALKANCSVLVDQQKVLQENELQLLATETNSCYDEARALRKRHSELQKELRAQENEICSATSEKQSMLRHLTEGAMSRCNILNDYRRSFQARAAPHEQSFLTQLLGDNRTAREDAFNIFLSSEQELDALRQYETVLKQRLDDAAQRLHDLSFHHEMKKEQAAAHK